MLSSYSGISYQKFITDLEVIRLIERHLADIAVDDNALALSAIIETGHGGEFLTHSHTLDQCRTVPWASVMAVPGDPKIGENAQEAYLTKVNITLNRILATYRRPVLEPKLQTALENFLVETGMDAKQLSMLKEAAVRS